MNIKVSKITVSIVVIILALTAMSTGFPSLIFAQAKEVGPREVQGEVLSIQTDVFHRGTIVVTSDQTGKTYTFYVGRRTKYYPARYPTVGETIKVLYIYDRGYLKATRVEIVQA